VTQATKTAVRRMRPVLGTFVEIGVFDPADETASAIAGAFDKLDEFQRLMSFQDRDSEISRLNRSAGHRVELSPLTLRTLRLARGMTIASGGLFNCTVGGALIERGRLPDHGEGAGIPFGTAEDIELHGRAARLRRPVRITVDGIAKGLAVDCALGVLRSRGCANAWINAGGDVRVMGRHALPVRRRGEADTLLLRNGAIATSGANTVYDPNTPGEIVDLDGAPIAEGAWTVFSPRAWRADALTKVAAIAPSSARASLMVRLGGRLIEERRRQTARAA
jgi:thiamine biosynthesis lipoprotein